MSESRLSAMDTPIALPWWRKKRWLRAAVAAGAGVLLVATAVAFRASAARTVRLEAGRVTLSTVERGVFHDFIPLRAKVVPRDTIYLDALEGGRVERVLVEPGDMVTAGQTLIELSNTELELSVLDREARLIESITQLQTYQTQLEQNRLSNDKALEQIDYNIVRLTRSVERYSKLAEQGLVAKEVRDALKDELDYTLSLRPLQAESNQQQNQLRAQQVPQINAQLRKLLQDIEVTRGKLDNLRVRAPIAGRMTAIDLKVGENRDRGARLGEITPDTGYKLTASIDEYYLGRVSTNQLATVRIGSEAPQVRVLRVYPQVRDGTFTIDLGFDGPTPARLLPGQAVQGKLDLGHNSAAVIVPAGAFLETTGGDWVFAVEDDKRSAERRTIKSGRRNSEQVEVLSGLRPGEIVITSDYSGLDHVDRVHLNQ